MIQSFARSEVFTARKIPVVGFWVVTPVQYCGGIPTFRKTMLPPSSGYPTTSLRISQPRRPRLESSSLRNLATQTEDTALHCEPGYLS